MPLGSSVRASGHSRSDVQLPRKRKRCQGKARLDVKNWVRSYAICSRRQGLLNGMREGPSVRSSSAPSSSRCATVRRNSSPSGQALRTAPSTYPGNALQLYNASQHVCMYANQALMIINNAGQKTQRFKAKKNTLTSKGSAPNEEEEGWGT